ncbi:hypothetical protein GCM10011519_00610 [Marmoricola endophyticus]|uniref:TIGR02206 family membrane protein n=1 Tax=Marmoricola endophyticus TaxID=2040280 RepID=A0A917B873_9ACTN|nr:TIGR02206 family membrane protein [Marmoricola endophyticus]GGF31049.1 hypothetical protein GCM10011519_00610 [Marmoricola endophyticus]
MTRFQAFGPEHLSLIALCVVVSVAIVLVGRRTGDSVVVRRTLAVVIPVFTVPLQVAQLLPGDFGLGTSLPLQVCDLTWMLAIYALWTRRRWATTLLYFWGLTLVPQAILTPSLEQLFPDPRYFMFWGMHFLSVWAAVWLAASGRREDGPDWRGYRTSVVITLAWVAAVMVLNAVLGTNYGYFNRKPSVGTALDYLGPWPVYVVAEVAVVALAWALITLPWTGRASRTSHHAALHPAGDQSSLDA